ncbi:hypothetical protein SAMN05421853_102378 [Roseivivax halotolerans]|uniref:Uncharacterized protein n=1 Tax=Roseivivax halotolerans TaxID=93684 RepID=A0A1I5WIT5_9RHOB|nr:hypothetical protein [Roseivivax halotolerans]SFQ19551.1 hypothetical protein SAMN05421853_102378 [Roseivivax halotolerans]
MLRPPLLLPLALAACTPAPNHLGNPLLLPVSALTTGAQNAAYNARRAEVKAVLAGTGPAVLHDANAQARLWRVAPVPVAERKDVLRDIADLPDPGSAEWIEAATVTVMVRL